MERNLIIFAGAGASCGVSQDKYPMAVGFREKLPQAITDLYLYQRLMNYLSKHGDGGAVDIEHVLWGLDRLLQALSEFTADDRFGSQLLRLAEISIVADNHPPPGQQTHAQFSLLEAKATVLKNTINERIYDFFAKPPNEGELDRSWVPLLRWAAGASFNRIDLVTTNYDLVLEYAMERVGQTLRVEEGWKRRVSETTLDLNRWDSSNASEIGLLTKLHGSVDWYRSGTSA